MYRSLPSTATRGRTPALFAILLGLALPNAAHAGGGVTCASKDGRAEIGISLGRQPTYAPTNAYVRLDKKRWVSVPQDGELQLGETQGLIEKDRFSADFTGPDIMKILISLRIDLTKDEEDDGIPGTLTFAEGGVHRVLCQFE